MAVKIRAKLKIEAYRHLLGSGQKCRLTTDTIHLPQGLHALTLKPETLQCTQRTFCL
jgi:hypothetical protein